MLPSTPAGKGMEDSSKTVVGNSNVANPLGVVKLRGRAAMPFGAPLVVIPYRFRRLAGFPRATRNMGLRPSASGEKNSVTSSSKNVRPVAPRRWA